MVYLGPDRQVERMLFRTNAEVLDADRLSTALNFGIVTR